MNTLNGIKIPIIIFAVIATYPFLLSSDTITSSFKKSNLFFYPIQQNHTHLPVKNSPNTCQPDDSLALIALYHATNGAAWTYTWDLTQAIRHLARRNAQRNGLRHRTPIAGQPTLRHTTSRNR